MLCKKLHHAAYRCNDARETADFYTQMLGLKFSHITGRDHVPSTGIYSPHAHLFFEMEDGSSIAFFECPKDKGNVKDLESPDWIQHFAFEIESEGALLQAKASLEDAGISVVGPTNHGFLRSIYFFDPSGHRLELAVRIEKDPGVFKRYEEQAAATLALWDQTHDWTLRDNPAAN